MIVNSSVIPWLFFFCVIKRNKSVISKSHVPGIHKTLVCIFLKLCSLLFQWQVVEITALRPNRANLLLFSTFFLSTTIHGWSITVLWIFFLCSQTCELYCLAIEALLFSDLKVCNCCTCFTVRSYQLNGYLRCIDQKQFKCMNFIFPIGSKCEPHKRLCIVFVLHFCLHVPGMFKI